MSSEQERTAARQRWGALTEEQKQAAEERAQQRTLQLELERDANTAQKRAERDAKEKEAAEKQAAIEKARLEAFERAKSEARNKAAQAKEKEALQARQDTAERELTTLRQRDVVGERQAVPSRKGQPPIRPAARDRNGRLLEDPFFNDSARGAPPPRTVSAACPKERPLDAAARAAPASEKDRSAARQAPATQGRNDDNSPRRDSNDSGVDLPHPRKGASRPIKAPTGHAHTAGNNVQGKAPPPLSPGIKRPASLQATNQEQDSVPKRQRVSISSAASLQSPTTPPEDASDERQPPAWYQAMSIDRTRSKGNQREADVDPLMKRFKNKISKVRNGEFTSADAQQSAMNEIRMLLHTMPFELVDEKLLRNNSMLTNAVGLPQLFDERYSGGFNWPFDIKADAKELYIKWCAKIFETDLLRGIIPGNAKSSSKERSADKIDEGWRQKHGASANYFGNGRLVNGQWWPTQLAALRDGAHGSAQAGIHGRTGEGAYSCVMAGNHEYSDKDDGDRDDGEVVLYCGADSDDGKIARDTQHMMTSYADGRPVRLFRSSKVQSTYAPEIGLRYDGLYDIESYERLDPVFSTRQRHRFKLVRQPGQDPIRGGDVPERRPTKQEIEAHHKDMRARGFSVKGKKGTVFPTW